MNETVTIPEKEYKRLQKDSELLNFLFNRGVDCWSGFAIPPNREDYETEEEYKKAYNNACDSYNW